MQATLDVLNDHSCFRQGSHKNHGYASGERQVGLPHRETITGSQLSF